MWYSNDAVGVPHLTGSHDGAPIDRPVGHALGNMNMGRTTGSRRMNSGIPKLPPVNRATSIRWAG